MGVFTHALNRVAVNRRTTLPYEARIHKGLVAWLLDHLHPHGSHEQSLRIVERIRVTPRQSFFLVEVEGERLLVATSDASAPVFHTVKKRSTATRNRRPIEIRIEGTCA